MSVTSILEYDEKKGILDVKDSNGEIKRFYLVTPEIYDKRYESQNLNEFIRKHVIGRCPCHPIPQ